MRRVTATAAAASVHRAASGDAQRRQRAKEVAPQRLMHPWQAAAAVAGAVAAHGMACCWPGGDPGRCSTMVLAAAVWGHRGHAVGCMIIGSSHCNPAMAGCARQRCSPSQQAGERGGWMGWVAAAAWHFTATGRARTRGRAPACRRRWPRAPGPPRMRRGPSGCSCSASDTCCWPAAAARPARRQTDGMGGAGRRRRRAGGCGCACWPTCPSQTDARGRARRSPAGQRGRRGACA